MKSHYLHGTILMFCTLAALAVQTSRCAAGESAAPPAWLKDSAAKLETELVGKYGEAQRARLGRGLRQVRQFWRAEDGDAAAFEKFVRENFAGDQATLDTVFNRFDRLLEKLGGHFAEMGFELRRQADLDLGPVLPMDETFGRLRARRPPDRRPLCQQAGLCRSAELSADDA